MLTSTFDSSFLDLPGDNCMAFKSKQFYFSHDLLPEKIFKLFKN